MRRVRLCGVLAALVLGGVAGAARAETFCVQAPSCAGTTEPTLPAALSAAASAPGRDRIELGAGGISYAGAATDAAGNPVDIVGAGRAITTLQTTGTVLSVQEPSTVVSDLRIVASGTPSTIVDLTAGTLRRVDVDATGTDAAANVLGVRLGGAGAAIDDASITMPGGQTNTGVRYDGAPADTPPVVHRLVANGLIGVLVTGGGSLTLDDGDLRGRSAALRVTGGSVAVDDTIVRVAGAAGLSAAVASGSSAGAQITARQVTVLLSAAATGLEASSSSTGQAATIQATDTVVHGSGTAAAASGVGGGSAAITLDYSSYAFAATTATPGTGSVTGGTAHHDLDDPAPQFVNESIGDARLSAGSPLVDAGDPTLTGGPATDLLGQPRTRDGNGDGAAVRDIGAYEYQRLAPTVAVTAAPGTGGTDQEFSFSALALDGDPGETPVVTWAFDDGTTATGTTASHAFATPGRHTATATANDPTGLTATASATVDVVDDNVPLPAHGPRIFVRILRTHLDRHRTFLIGVFCPATERPRCVGSITVTRGTARIAFTRLRIQPGGTQIASLRVSVRTANLAHRRRLPVVASVNATDLLGNATTKKLKVTLR